MPGKLHVVRLTPSERAEVRALLAAGRAPARTQTHARILLKCDTGAAGPRWSDARVAEAVEVSARTVARVRARFATQGLAAALGTQAPRPRVPAQVGQRPGSPPRGGGLHRAAVRVRPLESAAASRRLVELEMVDGISPETVRATLKKTSSSRG